MLYVKDDASRKGTDLDAWRLDLLHGSNRHYGRIVKQSVSGDRGAEPFRLETTAGAAQSRGYQASATQHHTHGDHDLLRRQAGAVQDDPAGYQHRGTCYG